MIRISFGQPVRPNRIWRYCALISLVLYTYAFYNLISFINSDESQRVLLRHTRPQTFDPGLRLFSKSPIEVDQQQRSVTTTIGVMLKNSDQTLTTDTGFLFPRIWKGILHFFQPAHESTETATVVNPYSFENVINASSLCQNNMDDIFLFVYVHSAPGNQRRRMVIRQTWGDVSQYDVIVRVIFVMGVSAEVLENEELQFEADTYGDILQDRFVDSYRNLTYKAMSALKWISGCGSRSNFILKTDDDIFVNTFVLLRHLELQLSRCGPGPCRGLLLCLVWDNMVVMREGKWKVEVSEWKDPTYPKYCSGSAFIMSADVVTSLLRASLDVPFLWVDDVYVTGLLPVRAGSINFVNYANYYLLDGKLLAEKFTGVQWYNYLFSHVQDLNSILSVWRKMAAISRGEISPTIQYLSIS